MSEGSSGKEREIWAIRENVPVALLQMSRALSIDNSSIYPGKLFKYDLSVPLRSWLGFLQEIRENIWSKGYLVASSLIEKNDISMTMSPTKPSGEINLEFCCFGHILDENLHLNVLVRPSDMPIDIGKVQKDLDDAIYPAVIVRNGSISAEHGIGQLKIDKMILAKSSDELKLMKDLKSVLDPRGILNPGKLFRY